MEYTTGNWLNCRNTRIKTAVLFTKENNSEILQNTAQTEFFSAKKAEYWYCREPAYYCRNTVNTEVENLQFSTQ